MESPNSEEKKYHLLEQALVDKLKSLGVFTGLANGFVKYNMSGNLELLADGCFVSVMTGVKAVYFCPYILDGSEIGGDIYSILGEITAQGIGVGLLTPSGYNWLVFDTDRYAETCKLLGHEEDEFRIFPQE